MQIHSTPIQIATVLPGAIKEDTPKGRTYLGEISTDKGNIKAYIKNLKMGDIAIEGLCAALAKKLRLPIPQPFYVALNKCNSGITPYNNDDLGFALKQENILDRRLLDPDSLNHQIMKWPDLYRCAVFDSWIANRDRLPNNLLYSVENNFWIIDHDEALPKYLDMSSSVSPQLLTKIAEGKHDIAKQSILNELMDHANTYLNIDWNEIIEHVRGNFLTGHQKDIDRHIFFLQQRAKHMRSILSQDLGIRQANLALTPTITKKLGMGKK